MLCVGRAACCRQTLVEGQHLESRPAVGSPLGDCWRPRAGILFAAHAIAVDSKGDFYVSQVNWSAGAKNGSLPDDHQIIQKFSRLA